MTRSKFVCRFGVLGVMALGAIACGCKKAEGRGSQAAAETVAVTLGTSKLDQVQRSVEVVGTLFGDEETTLSAKVPGRVMQIFKDVGDDAPAGEALAQIDKTDYELGVAQKKMAVQSSLSKLGLTELPPADFDFNKVPTVERARLQSANAEAKFNRGKQLFEKKPTPISEQDFADMQTAYKVAKSDYDVALLTAKSLVADTNSLNAQLDIESQRLRDTTIRTPPAASGPTTQPSAPRSYAVAARLVSIGEYVREGTPLFRLVANDPIKFRAQVPERFLSQIKTGQTVHITVDAYRDTFEGKVARISPQIETASRTFLVEILIPNVKRMLQPGAFARGSILTHTDPQVTLVPRQAVVTFAGISKVFTVKDGKAVEMKIETGQPLGDDIEVVKGLSGPIPLVVDGAGKLAMGTPVNASSGSTTRAVAE